MQFIPSPLVRLPRVLLEHPLPTSGDGITASLEISTPEGFPQLIQFGRVDPWQRATSPDSNSNLCPGFTLDSLTLLGVLLSLTERLSGTTLTYNQLFRALTQSRSCCSAHHRESLKSSLANLSNISLALTQPSAPSAPVQFENLIRLTTSFTRPIFGRPAPAFAIHFSPALLQLLSDPRASAPLHLPALLSLRSRQARSLYLILSTWAHYARAHAAHPFRITLARLISHLNQPIPRFISQRRAFFFGHRSRSLFDELENLPTPYGRLRLSIIPSVTSVDDCLCAWLEDSANLATSPVPLPAEAPVSPAHSPRVGSSTSSRRISSPVSVTPVFSASLPSPSSSGSATVVLAQPKVAPARGAISFSPSDPLAPFRRLKLYQAWAASGRADALFLQRVRDRSIIITQEDLSMLLAAGITPSSCESFLLMSKKLLGPRTWLDLLGEAKYAAHSPTPPRSPSGKLIAEILSSIRGAL